MVNTRRGTFSKLLALVLACALVLGVAPRWSASASGVEVADTLAPGFSVTFERGFFPQSYEAAVGDTDVVFYMNVTAAWQGDSGATAVAPPVGAPADVSPIPEAPSPDDEFADDEPTDDDGDGEPVGEEPSANISPDNSNNDTPADSGQPQDGNQPGGDAPEPPADAPADTPSSGDAPDILGDIGAALGLAPVRVLAAEPPATLGDITLWWYQDSQRRADMGSITIDPWQHNTPIRAELRFDEVWATDSGLWTLRVYDDLGYVESPYDLNLTVEPIGIIALSDVTVGDQAALRAAVNFTTSPRTITLTSDITLIGDSLLIPANANITLTGSHDLIAGGAFRVIYIEANASLTIDGITITGGNPPGSDSPGASGGGVLNRGTLALQSGTISDNEAWRGGGVQNWGTFAMWGGLIDDNEARSNNGGGVANESGATFTMHNGTISNNEAVAFGGGIQNAGTFVMNGGTISGNEAGQGGGVNIGLANVGTFTMTGGEIANNTSQAWGGGVNIGAGTTFTMSGGYIKYNDANFGGGGVNNSGTFTMSGTASITGNTAQAQGAGVNMSSSQNEYMFIMNGGTISYNVVTGVQSAVRFGGGVNIGANNTFTMNDGEISYNEAENLGGGVHVEAWGTLIMNGGRIANNTAYELGNDVYINMMGYVYHNDGYIGHGAGLNRTIFRVLSVEQIGGMSSQTDTSVIRVEFDVPIIGLRAEQVVLGGTQYGLGWGAADVTSITMHDTDGYIWNINIENIRIDNESLMQVAVFSSADYERYVSDPIPNVRVYRYVPIGTHHRVFFDIIRGGLEQNSNPVVQYIDNGGDATPPILVSLLPWWDFLGWNADYTNITDDVTITAMWEFVGIPVIDVAFDVTDFELLVGGTRQLSATAMPANATLYFLRWYSSNTDTATVNVFSGVVTAISPGTTVITARVSDGMYGVPYFDGTVTVTVRLPIPCDCPGNGDCADCDCANNDCHIPAQITHTPPVNHGAPSHGRGTPSHRPGTPPFVLHEAMAAARRAISEVSATASNSITADTVLGAVRAVMPQGAAANWPSGTHFVLVPATAGQSGSITGLMIISAGPYSSAIPLNITIPALGVTMRTFILRLDSYDITDQDGNTVITMDVLPVIQDGRTLIPVRFVAQALGASVSWNDSTREVTLTQDGQSLTFAIGETAPGMDVPAQIINDRTMVPLRFISEFFGASVTWHEAERTIEITQ